MSLMENGAIDQTKKLINKMGDISLRGKGVVRVPKQLGGPMSSARRDMTHGYYKPDMGMRGGQMFRGGGVVKKRGSIGVALKKGGSANWIQDVNKSIKKRGTKGKCTPITKPGCTGRAKALAKTFKKMAKKRKG